MIHFKLKPSTGVVYFREGQCKDNYMEIWLPEDKIEMLQHEYDCGEDTYHINQFEVSKEEFEKVLLKLQENKIFDQLPRYTFTPCGNGPTDVWGNPVTYCDINKKGE